jgi:hypothetical protein
VAWGAGTYLVAWGERVGTADDDVFGLLLPSELIFRDGFQAGT